MEHGDQLEVLLFGGLDVACPVVTRSAVPLVLVQVAAAHPAEAPSEAPAGGLQFACCMLWVRLTSVHPRASGSPRQIQQAAEKRAQNIQAARHGRSSQQSRNMIRTSGCM